MAYEYPTNFTFGNETMAVTGIGSLITYSQYATNGVFASGFLLIIFLMVFTLSSLVDVRKSFASASFVTLIFSVYFARIEAINLTIPFFLLAMTIVGFFLAKGGSGSNY